MPSTESEMLSVVDLNYRNKTVINQRGATVEINNSTDREELKLSQFSGSNVTLNNLVNSELATNNKQTKVINDSFESVGKDKNTFVGKDKVTRVVENTYDLRGFSTDTQIGALSSWKQEMVNKEIPGINSQFPILRGGYAMPPGLNSVTELDGDRAENSTKNQSKEVVNNMFTKYCPVPIRSSKVDEVVEYEPVGPPLLTPKASGKSPKDEDINTGSGEVGSRAPGVLEFGTELNAATEGGTWEENELRQELPDKLKELQEEKLNEIEQKIGNGGDTIQFIKRNKFETVGGAVNDFPSIRIDPYGRSQPMEVAVGEKTTYTNVDYVPTVEDVNSDLNFPGGDYTLNVGNKYNVIVGAGGVQIKTSGSVEIGGTSVKVAANKINLMASAGMHLTSETLVELQSDKSISLRSKRQIYIEPGLGVKSNLVVGGGTYVEGELYVNHITAPVEIQQTEDTLLLGRFNCRCDRVLAIGEVNVGGTWYTVYGYGEGEKAEDLIFNYPHSHHFKNIPLRTMASNEDVRVRAQCEGINSPTAVVASSQHHERKPVLTSDDERCSIKVKEGDCPSLTETPPEEEICEIIEDYLDPNSSSGASVASADPGDAAAAREYVARTMAQNPDAGAADLSNREAPYGLNAEGEPQAPFGWGYTRNPETGEQERRPLLSREDSRRLNTRPTPQGGFNSSTMRGDD